MPDRSVNGVSLHYEEDGSGPLLLLLHGDADPVVPVAHAHELHAAIPGARLRLYPGAGHQPHREHEADTRARILAFLAES